MDIVRERVTSRDGTTIAFERSGSGPTMILVDAAMADHTGSADLGKLLAPKFTVVNYDRRGRGQSTNTTPYAVDREIEDIDALIDEVGAPAYLFGYSSGAVLALEAANKLGSRVKGLAMFEPPFIIDKSRPPLPADYVEHLNELLAEGRRDDAVVYFMEQAMRIPSDMLAGMRRIVDVARPGCLSPHPPLRWLDHRRVPARQALASQPLVFGEGAHVGLGRLREPGVLSCRRQITDRPSCRRFIQHPSAPRPFCRHDGPQ